MTSFMNAAHHLTDKQLPDVPDTSGQAEGPDGTAGQSLGLRHRLRRLNLTIWLWETLSLLMSTACVGAILFILAHYDNQPIPTWRYGLTINGVVSILAVIAKAAMILPIAECISQLKWAWYWGRERQMMDFERFDLASRGPWGSITMLVFVRLWSLGAIGAALTVTALAMEPSLQQIPAFPARLVRSGSAYMARSTHWVDYESSQVDFSDGVVLANSVKRAVWDGILSTADRGSPAYSPTCATGNCTWPAYSSLAVCSACENVTSFIFQSNFNSGTTPWWNLNISYGYELTNAQYSLYATADPNDASLVYPGVHNHSILDVVSVYWPPHRHDNWAESTAPSGVYECLLYFCVKTFEGSTLDGVFSERTVDIWPDANETIPVQQEPSPLQRGPAYPWHVNNFTLSPPGHSESYTIDILTFGLLRQWMSQNFGGALEHSFQAQDYIANALDTLRALYDEQTRMLGPDVTVHNQTVPGTAGPGHLMERIADSLSTYLRQVADSPSAAVGDAQSVSTFVQARWAWAVLPVALLAITMAFVLATVLLSARKGIPMWKSSSLVSLLHGLDEATSQAITATRLDDMETNTKAYLMAMTVEHKRWRLEGRAR